MDVAAGEGSNQHAAVRIVPATAERWPRLGHVFGSREKDPSSCWCQRFLRHGEFDNRSALRREVQDAEVPIGLLAYLDDSVVAIRVSQTAKASALMSTERGRSTRRKTMP